MAASGAGAEGEELRLLAAVEAGDAGAPAAEKSWRLNFDGFRPPEAHQERPARGLHHHCLGVIGTSFPDTGVLLLYTTMRIHGAWSMVSRDLAAWFFRWGGCFMQLVMINYKTLLLVREISSPFRICGLGSGY